VSRIGIATSDDGIHFSREAEPVVFPEHDYESAGCEDPRITLIRDAYYLTYTGFDGANAQLCVATSPDLRDWTKQGPIVPGFNTWATLPYGPDKPWSKAGVIHPEPIGGLYYLYFGEGAIYYATSPDLLNWTPCDERSPILAPRPSGWDSTIVEIGAPPVMTDDGRLLFLYNGARAASMTEVDYRCGQFAISLTDPTTVVAREAEPWLQPQTFEDTHGLVSNVTFVEGLVRFGGRWLAYYGQSDTTLAVAVAGAGAGADADADDASR
jgi:beta-1,2-mannosidase